MASSPARPAGPDFTFVGGRLWLEFVNTDDARLGVRVDTIASFDRFVDWLEAARVLDAERAQALRRRAAQQPSGATAALGPYGKARSAWGGDLRVTVDAAGEIEECDEADNALPLGEWPCD